MGADYVANFHGMDGPVRIAFPTNMFTGPANPYLVDTVRDVTKAKLLRDLSGGEANGVAYIPVVRAKILPVVSTNERRP